MSEGSSHPLIGPLERSYQYARLRASVEGGDCPASVFGLSAGCRHQLYASLASDTGRRLVVVTATEAGASQLADEIGALWEGVRRLPARDLSAASRALASSGAIQTERIRALTDFLRGEATVIVACAEAVMQPLAPRKVIEDAVMRVAVGDVCEPRTLLRQLSAAGYEPVDRCETPGQVCLRGGRVDVFPVWGARPYRIEFFDNEIDTMREYDPATQRATDNISEAWLPPATETPLTEDAVLRARERLGSSEEFSRELTAMENGAVPQRSVLMLDAMYDTEWLTDYAGSDAVIILDEAPRIEERMTEAAELYVKQAAEAMLDGANAETVTSLCSAEESLSRLDTRRTLLVMAMTRQFRPIASKTLFRIEGHDMPEYTRAHDALAQDVATWHGMGFTVAIYAGSFARRLASELTDEGVDATVVDRLQRDLFPGETVIIAGSVKRGFEYPELKLAVISQRELYGHEERKVAAPKPSKNKLDMGDIAVGDIVVHDVYGIGRYMGIEPVTVDGNTRDYLIIQYAGSDRLLLPTEQLGRLSRYVGGDSPRISKMGSADWQRAVARVRRSVKELAFDLMELYGARSRLTGFKFSPDTPWQREMESEFPYQETPDQLTCINDVKRDMESGRVMDRLVCGDVGYGKTEVAVRAAFKAVQDGKQVAVLVPTTILAQQHYNTFTSRFSGFPVRVELLSRFKTAEEQRRILETLRDGRTDIVIGTHKLLGKSVGFKDLGLLIVDEEQRFGVGHKEQIKNLKRQVAVLTMTATPIPRTLHMSMTGIRDMSVIETPPERRHPVQTYVMEYSPALAREVILRELNRGGQTYFVYNDVKSMDIFAARLRELVPEARITYAHGQMPEKQLEATMLDFLEGRFDVLLCSTIIESGLDIPNVNTILIYNADNMGLSQLYQLRGRVGRSSRLGYAYLTFLPFKVLTEVAEKRLNAIREFTQFGAGFKIALRDLEIRGAGNLLGAEQHGHMAEIGYELYCRLMEQAVKELKGENVEEETPETAMEIPVDAYLPSEYVPNEEDRLEMYRRIAAICDEETRMDVEDELIDRFGELPPPAARLIEVAMLKAAAQRAYITRISVSGGEMQLRLHPRAPIDGDRLLAFVTKTQGVGLAGGDTPMVTYRKRNADAEALLRLLPQFVHTIFNCITDANKV